MMENMYLSNYNNKQKNVNIYQKSAMKVQKGLGIIVLYRKTGRMSRPKGAI